MVDHAMTGREMRDIRKELRYSQAQWGMLWGVHSQTVSDWERGKYDVPEYVAIWSQVLLDNPTARDQVERLVGVR